MGDSQLLPADAVQRLKNIAHRLRIYSIKATNASNSGHPTSCCSMAEIMSVLFFHTMKYKVQEPKHPSSDRFILSKGHAAPILYAAWCEAGLIPEDELLNLRKIDSDLEGHPTPRLSFIDVATGSLGQGLSFASGMAYTGKYLEKASFRVFCIMGDGEAAEGSVWEAMAFASHYKLNNLVAIFDVNRLGQSEPTMLKHDTDVYQRRCESFGFNTYVVDGHDVVVLVKALADAEKVTDRPTAIIAKTLKGKSLPGIEDQENWHGKALGAKADAAIQHLLQQISGTVDKPHVIKAPVDDAPLLQTAQVSLSESPNYKLGQLVATRAAYGTALVKLGTNSKYVIALDADTKNSTFSEKFRNAFPDRFIECFIAEQNLIGVAVGCQTRNRTIPFTSTFATFYTRAFDQLRMAAICRANINCCGSHCGVSIGEDGPSQMGLEDLALFRSLPGSTVFYPSDAVSTERACELAANTQGICFIRTSRPATAVLYSNEEPFAIGKAKILKKSSSDVALVIGAGVTLHEALKAAEALSQEGINVRVVDPFTIKPLDVDLVRAQAKECGGRIITVEDHYPEGGLGDAVSAAVGCCRDVIQHRLAVNAVPHSGQPDELLDLYGINAKHIIKAVHAIRAK